MKKLYLTSSVNFVAAHIAGDIKLSPEKNKLVFITTPAEVEEGDLQWLKDDRNALIKAGFDVSDYTITGKTEIEIRKDLSGMDFIYVSGGNVFYLLQKSQENNFCAIINDSILKGGKIYIGTSAGSIVTGPDTYPTYKLDNPSKRLILENYAGFGLVDFIVFPHWGSDYFKVRYLRDNLPHAYNTKKNNSAHRLSICKS